MIPIQVPMVFLMSLAFVGGLLKKAHHAKERRNLMAIVGNIRGSVEQIPAYYCLNYTANQII